jgi:hypothetical protein
MCASRAIDLSLYAALAAITDNVSESKGDWDQFGALTSRGVVRAEVFSGAA